MAGLCREEERVPTPAIIGPIIDRAFILARQKGVALPAEDLRRVLAERLFRELRAELRLSPRY